MFLSNESLYKDHSSSEEKAHEYLSTNYPQLKFIKGLPPEASPPQIQEIFNVHIATLTSEAKPALNDEHKSKISLGYMSYSSDTETLSLFVDTSNITESEKLICEVYKIIEVYLSSTQLYSVSLKLLLSEQITKYYPDIYTAIIHMYCDYTKSIKGYFDTRICSIGEDIDEKQILFYNIYYKAICDSKLISDMPPNIATPGYMNEWVHMIFDHIDSAIVSSMHPDSNQFVFTSHFKDAEGHAPEIVKIEYNPGIEVKSHIVLVGKGVTFDAGGMALKNTEIMQMMKYDKIGAVMTVLATYIAAAIGLPVKITALVIFCENILRNDSIKPGSIYTTENQLVDINNPDGEGRLLLADCFEYAKQLNDIDYVIAIATLTGDSYNVFGDVMMPYFSNSADLKGLVEAASEKSNEKIWMMPIDKEFEKYLSTGNPRVIKNYSNSVSKLITSGYFISKFASPYQWVYFDMAGISVKDGHASGRPLLFLVNCLIGLSEL